eukprot:GEMP01047443.1.p1 GENE.GEMP01047443.1~~GEMP01047443.1.p1  ORF type:complete len:356 (+),score=64.04 GEMP01047443.1:240-1307(+)
MTSTNPDASELRTFTFEELAEYNGRKRPERYLCLLGHVFDVSVGTNSGMYEKPMPYSCFVGRDATTAFVTGDFHGAKRPLSEAWDYSVLDARQMAEAVGWSDFYRTHRTYKHVGTLIYPEGKNPRDRAVDPYDPLVEQSGAVSRYQLGWLCADPLSWVARGQLRVNYKNEYGGIKALLFGTCAFWDDQVAVPPSTCWAADSGETGKGHSIVAIWTTGAHRDEKTLDTQIKKSEKTIKVPDHFVFWGVTSHNKHFVGRGVPAEAVRGSWVGPDDARRKLKLRKDDVLCLIVVWVDETLPDTLPERFWSPSTVMAIHFGNVGSQEQLVAQGFVSSEPEEESGGRSSSDSKETGCTIT